jgi:hypothetical protein
VIVIDLIGEVVPLAPATKAREAWETAVLALLEARIDLFRADPAHGVAMDAALIRLLAGAGEARA